ncbi:MAG: hypothetical protein NPIRA02_31390 [Nitrospirales bacterium]|nr:MAG: hypothetical protein NPIRA02_31390 [Nitrospirales bacterium]
MSIRLLLTFMLLGCPMFTTAALANQSAFTAQTTDASGVEMTLGNARLYWEDQIDETTFVPHEITHVPVKRGTATVNVKFENIKHIDVKPGASAKDTASLTIALQNGKSGEFPLAKNVSLIGDSDFGQIKVPVKDLKTIVFTSNASMDSVQSQSKSQ